jgi:hypothetical protein
VQPDRDFFVASLHLLCLLAAFKSVTFRPNAQPGIYETLVLKKIDFDPLLNEIQERLKKLLLDSRLN